MADMGVEETLVMRRSRRSTAGNRMQAALAEMNVDELAQDAEEDVDFVVKVDEEDVFESDFASTEEEEADEEAGEKVLEEEERLARKAARQKAFKTPKIPRRVAFDTPTPHNDDKNLQGPSSTKPRPTRSNRRVSLGQTIDAETGEVMETPLAKRQSTRESTRINRQELQSRLKDAENRRVSLTKRPPKEVKRRKTQADLIAAALDLEEENIKSHREYLAVEEERRRKARVVKPVTVGPKVRWRSRIEDVAVTVYDTVPAPHPTVYPPRPPWPSPYTPGAPYTPYIPTLPGQSPAQSPFLYAAYNIPPPPVSAPATTTPQIPVPPPQPQVSTTTTSAPASADPPPPRLSPSVPPPSTPAPTLTTTSSAPIPPPSMPPRFPGTVPPPVLPTTKPKTPPGSSKAPASVKPVASTSTASTTAPTIPVPTSIPAPTTATGPAPATTTPAPPGTFPPQPSTTPSLPYSYPGYYPYTYYTPTPNNRTGQSQVPYPSYSHYYPYTPSPATAGQQYSLSRPHLQLQPPTQVARKTTEKQTKNYVEVLIDEGRPKEKPSWRETMDSLFGKHADWDNVRVYVGKNRPLSRQIQTCPITGLSARYRDPRSGVPYANLGAFRILSRLLEHEYVWSSTGAAGGVFVGHEKQRGAIGVPDGWADAMAGIPPKPREEPPPKPAEVKPEKPKKETKVKENQRPVKEVRVGGRRSSRIAAEMTGSTVPSTKQPLDDGAKEVDKMDID
ncbi:hypothetical protein Clacol_008117 [Clathrus columnatus]|uniref:Vps72/YL1 C-terminal domain-containing protein n=1 Tax=Clathrus columnatus TaxID=1419009 RepID=A0AAV5AHM4_9AGAM|nr:hypothetical protein Clacol_008117 [Clathrus columnatus]